MGLEALGLRAGLIFNSEAPMLPIATRGPYSFCSPAPDHGASSIYSLLASELSLPPRCKPWLLQLLPSPSSLVPMLGISQFSVFSFAPRILLSEDLDVLPTGCKPSWTAPFLLTYPSM